MRILISAGWLGGAGGAERALYSILRALGGHDVDVVVRQRLGGPLAEIGDGVRLYPPTNPRWFASSLKYGVKGQLVQRLVNPVRRAVLPRYDVLLAFHSGPDLTRAVRASVKLLVPSGNHISVERASGYDHVALQAPDNQQLAASGVPTTLLPPPVFDLAVNSLAPAVDLPGEFCLTVFNPYDPIKGTDDLLTAVESTPRPIVWCHSQQTVGFDVPAVLRDHPRIIHVEDASPAEMRYLYERCLAYVCFSRSEGFGWSIADALRYSPVIVSRRIGVLSFGDATRHGVLEVGRDWDFDWARIADAKPEATRDLRWLSAAAFEQRLVELVVRGTEKNRD